MTFRASSRFARFAGILSVSALALSTACSDSITAPATAPQLTARNGLLGDIVGTVTGVVSGLLTPAKALTRDVAVPAMTRTFTFTRAGGRIEIPETGLRIDVPADAIPSNVLTITVTVLPGKSVAYDFAPHGTKFRKPLVFRQDLANTSWSKPGFKGALSGGYFAERSQLDLLSGLALLNEVLPLTINNRTATFNIHHFSGYMVSSGKYAESDSEF